MGSKKEIGGVVLAFGGFVFLVMSVKGTWGNVWGALTGKKLAASSSTSSAPGFPGTGTQMTAYRLPTGVIPSAPTSSGGGSMQTAPLPASPQGRNV